jgi:hypothetical protein
MLVVALLIYAHETSIPETFVFKLLVVFVFVANNYELVATTNKNQ